MFTLNVCQHEYLYNFVTLKLLRNICIQYNSKDCIYYWILPIYSNIKTFLIIFPTWKYIRKY
jgi:hypothetical protein